MVKKFFTNSLPVWRPYSRFLSVFYHQKPGDCWPRVKIRGAWWVERNTHSAVQSSETSYFWDQQFLAVYDTSLLSRSTCCVGKWPERSESVCSTHSLSVNFAEVHGVCLWWNQSVWTADEVADCVISERLNRLLTKDLFYKFSCGGWFAVRLPLSATNYSSTGRQNIPTGRHFCRPVTMLNEAMN